MINLGWFWSKKPASFLILITTTVVFFLFQAFVAHNYSQSQRFGDEVGHLVAGHFINKGLIPYKDLQLNHQPLNYIFSAATEKLTQPNSLYTYIGRQRDAIFVYSLVWQLLYLLTFGLTGLLFSLIFEIVKYTNSGYKLLGETLATYPLVFMFGVTAKQILLEQNLRKRDILFFSVSSFVVIFSLATLWPTTLFLSLMCVLLIKKDRQKIWFLFIPFFVLTVFLFFYIPPNTYVKETIIYNIRYLMPVIDRVKTIDEYFKIIFLPFTTLQGLKNTNSQIVLFFLIVYALLTYRFFRNKKIIIWGILLIPLTFSNLRVADVTRGNFHLLPYFAIYIFLGVYLLLNDVSHFSFVALITFLLIFTVWIYISQANFLFRRKNLQTEHYNNYALSQRYGAAVRVIKDDDDRLLSLPYDPLVYWIADMRPAIRVLEYYSWIYAIPEYRHELKTVFEKNPPEFIVDAGLDEDGQLDKLVLHQLKQKYVRASHLAAPSNLYILKKKLPEITPKQRNDFKYLLFEAP